MTAKEFLNKRRFEIDFTEEGILIEFAKYHVEQALESASNEADTKIEEVYNGSMGNEDGRLYTYCNVIDKDSIKNAYPLENIK